MYHLYTSNTLTYTEPGVSELEIVREGDNIILRPVRPTWGSFAQLDKADPNFMAVREDVISDEGRVDL